MERGIDMERESIFKRQEPINPLPPPPSISRRAAILNTPFDPEGEGYDLKSAKAAGMRPAGPEAGENVGHMGTTADTTPNERKEFGLPDESYLILKGRKHESWADGVAGEKRRGFKVIKRGRRYYSVPGDFE